MKKKFLGRSFYVRFVAKMAHFIGKSVLLGRSKEECKTKMVFPWHTGRFPVSNARLALLERTPPDDSVRFARIRFFSCSMLHGSVISYQLSVISL